MTPKISIAIPTHDMKDKDFFLNRCLDSIRSQSFQDYEIVITDKGKMAENTNRAMKECTGELIKVMYMDDYFAHKDSLKLIVEAIKGKDWLVSGCIHDYGDGIMQSPHFPSTHGIEDNVNTIGSPSVMTIRNGLGIYFDESMTWLLDVDVYKRLLSKCGEPVILDDINVVIGVGEHQTTNLLSEEIKNAEFNYLKNK